MDTQFRFGEQTIRHDKQATIEFYEHQIQIPGADECRCASCKNFAAQRATAFSNELLSFLAGLGIDPRKEWEVFDYDAGLRDREKLHQYGGWFVFCGNLVEGENWRPEASGCASAYWFTTSFPSGGLPKDAEISAVEFLIVLPWVIAEAPDQPELPTSRR